MDVVIKVPAYDELRGLRFEWDDEFEIALSVGEHEVAITANTAGLRSLARHLLTLAQDGVPDRHHIHLTADQEIDSSIDLVIERKNA